MGILSKNLCFTSTSPMPFFFVVPGLPKDDPELFMKKFESLKSNNGPLGRSLRNYWAFFFRMGVTESNASMRQPKNIKKYWKISKIFCTFRSRFTLLLNFFILFCIPPIHCYICAGRASYDQLLFNPPGGKPSKGRRLSGAIWDTCPIFFASSSHWGTPRKGFPHPFGA